MKLRSIQFWWDSRVLCLKKNRCWCPTVTVKSWTCETVSWQNKSEQKKSLWLYRFGFFGLPFCYFLLSIFFPGDKFVQWLIFRDKNKNEKPLTLKSPNIKGCTTSKRPCWPSVTFDLLWILIRWWWGIGDWAYSSQSTYLWSVLPVLYLYHHCSFGGAAGWFWSQ